MLTFYNSNKNGFLFNSLARLRVSNLGSFPAILYGYTITELRVSSFKVQKPKNKSRIHLAVIKNNNNNYMPI